jgi:putative nucleotide binding protein
MPNEENAIVLDYLPRGKSTSYKTEPLAQVLGTEFFTLLEVVPKAELKILEKVYIGKEEREKISLIKRRIDARELTSTATGELEKATESIVAADEKRFVEFFNNTRPITIKMHQLELLPGLGKKHMFNILDVRQKKKFESFKDIEERVPLMPNVLKIVTKRILEELQVVDEKHYLFCRHPSRQQEFEQKERFSR